MGLHPCTRNALLLLEKTLQRGVDDPDALVGIPAGELFDWAWLITDVSEWLTVVGSAISDDFTDHFLGTRTTQRTAAFLAHIGERMAALLDGDRGQP
jgi:hypothetical protein